MRLRDITKHLCRVLFGYDLFLSYRRADAATYAENLATELEKLGFTCFLDLEETVAGVDLTPALRRALRRSRMLVVVLTPGVLDSTWVRQEIEAFLPRLNRLIPINVDRFLASSDVDHTPLAALRDRSWIDESSASLGLGRPSKSVVDQIRHPHRLLRVRTLGRLLAAVVTVMLAASAAGLVPILVEEHRHAQIAHVDIGKNVARLTNVLDFIVVRYVYSLPLEVREANPTLGKGVVRAVLSGDARLRADSLSAPELVELFTQVDFADAALDRPVPIIGFNFSPPGDGREVARIVAAETSSVVADLNAIWRQDLMLADGNILNLAKQVAEDPFILSLSTVDARMARYHDIEEARLPFLMLGNPGLGQPSNYLSFVEKLRRLSSSLSQDR